MKKVVVLIMISFSAGAQTNRYYIKQNIDVTTHSQADVDAFYKGYCQTKDLAWQYYNNGEYDQAIYYAKRIDTSILDGDYLYSQKTQILCLSYAHIGDMALAEKYLKKVRRKSPPNDIAKVESEISAINRGETNVNKGKYYYTPSSNKAAAKEDNTSDMSEVANNKYGEVRISENIVELPGGKVVINAVEGTDVFVIKIDPNYPDYYYVKYFSYYGYIPKSAVGSK